LRNYQRNLNSIYMSNGFPPPEPDTWTWNVTFEPNTTTPELVRDKDELERKIKGGLPPKMTDANGNTVSPEQPRWMEVDGEHWQVAVGFVDPNGSKASRGTVRPPAVTKPPASRVLAVEFAR
jgi:hypothetical protein